MTSVTSSPSSHCVGKVQRWSCKDLPGVTAVGNKDNRSACWLIGGAAAETCQVQVCLRARNWLHSSECLRTPLAARPASCGSHRHHPSTRAVSVSRGRGANTMLTGPNTESDSHRDPTTARQGRRPPTTSGGDILVWILVRDYTVTSHVL
ncbi:hypothetical protein C0Q70_02018 [Pomacea canaliculata]|uniref:Uncharacterized protein n=1 Tax=Pomacea canaliculata TaxID=400727 RepID=A0A2T7Q149_POMCA|nr:hypothetical protein C0Q70_02018 [Pomacea canaliculata]